MKKLITILTICLCLLTGCASKPAEEPADKPETEEKTSISQKKAEENKKVDLSAYNGEWDYTLDGFDNKMIINAPDVDNGYGMKVKISESDNPDYEAMVVYTKEALKSDYELVLYLGKIDGQNATMYVFNEESKKYDSIPMKRVSDNSTAVSQDKKEENKTDTPDQTPSSNTKPKEETSSQSKGHYEERTVLVREAYDEQVVVKEGWTEQILVKEGWTESYEECIEYKQDATPVYICYDDGRKFYNSTECAHECLSSYYEDYEYGETYCSRYDTKTINHPAEYNYIEHEPEYTTVHHDAEYKTEKVWVED